MAKRLQVIVDDEDYLSIQQSAREQRMTVAEWVRQSLRNERRRATVDRASKLAAISEATRHAFPTGDIDDILADIERSRLST